MHLLNVDTFKLEYFVSDPPPYAILSHTWGSDSEEVSYRDVLDGRLDTAASRPPKIAGCCKTAKENGYQYVWIDTCCINKSSSTELHEAITSMFKWYRDAAICYAYLSDVIPEDGSDDFRSHFRSARWFQRGWTLQELLAPLRLRFYNAGWEFVGTKGDLCDLVEEITGIPTEYLLGITELHHASVAQRMSWAANRTTKREEDMGYCLLGIFGVFIPMMYGEGSNAFRRLQEEIAKKIPDDSLLAWGIDTETLAPLTTANPAFGTALAPSPLFFAGSGKIVVKDSLPHASFEMNGSRLRVPLQVTNYANGQIFALLKCGREDDSVRVTIQLGAAPGESDGYFRLHCRAGLALTDQKTSATPIWLHLDAGHRPSSQPACWFQISRRFVANLKLVDVHPASCWHKDRALIDATVKPAADGIQPILARFRQTSQQSADFVAVLQVDSQDQPRCDLMIASSNTSLEEIAENSDAWRDMVNGKDYASNVVMNLTMVLENVHGSSSQRRFLLKPVVVTGKPAAVTVNATTAIQVSGSSATLQVLARAGDKYRANARGLRQDIRLANHRVSQTQADLERLRAEIEELKLKERQAAELHNREIELNSRLLDEYKQAKKTAEDMSERASGLERFIDIYSAGKTGPEHEQVLSRTAARTLPFAIRDGHNQFARLLIDKASDVTIGDDAGVPPLNFAVDRGDEGLVQLLLNKGADVSAVNKVGDTPLHQAVSQGLSDIALLLLEKGASVTAIDVFGQTPLDLAASSGDEELLSLLERYRDNATAARPAPTPSPSHDLPQASPRGQDNPSPSPPLPARPPTTVVPYYAPTTSRTKRGGRQEK